MGKKKRFRGVSRTKAEEEGASTVVRPPLRIEEVLCKSAMEFIEQLSPYRPHWTNSLESHWLFRGQADSKWRLEPSAWRKNTGRQLLDFVEPLRPIVEGKVAKVTQQLRKSRASRRSPLPIVELLMQLQAEYEAVRQFATLADELGFGLFDSDWAFIRTESPIIRFEKLYGTQKDWWNELAAISAIHGLAQHHGIPTRVLDWTKDPEIAAYFAAEGCVRRLSDAAIQDKPANLAVWCLHEIEAYTNEAFRKVEFPRSNNHFLRVQKAAFLYLPTGNDYFIKHNEWPTAEDVLASTSKNPIRDHSLRRLLLPSEYAEELLMLLWRKNISCHNLMPTLDNVANSTKQFLGWSAKKLATGSDQIEQLGKLFRA